MYLCEEEEKRPSFINELVRGIKNPLKGVTKYEPQRSLVNSQISDYSKMPAPIKRKKSAEDVVNELKNQKKKVSDELLLER